MGISDRLLGKKNVNGHPHIEEVHPGAALPGGEVRIVGKQPSALTNCAGPQFALARSKAPWSSAPTIFWWRACRLAPLPGR